jgi:hypothetical protein
VSAEEVTENDEQKPEEDDPGEEDEERPQQVAEVVRGKRQQCVLLDSRGDVPTILLLPGERRHPTRMIA